MYDKINPKTKIIERRHFYHDIVNVKSAKELKKNFGLLEHGLGRCLEVFFGVKFKGGSKKTELRVYEIKMANNLDSLLDVIITLL